MRRKLIIGASMAGAPLLLAALVAALLVVGNTDRGRVLIEQLTHRLTSGHVTLSGLGGSFPAELSLARLELSDDRGIWLTAERISLRWSPLALLTRHVKVESLQVARVDMERTPISRSESKAPTIPDIDVGTLSADRVQLGAQLVGSPASLSVHGRVHLRTLQDASAEITARRTDGDGDYELHLQFDPRRMDATLKLQEPAGGPLENLLGVPGLGALAVTTTLHGPRNAEQIDLSLDAGSLRGRAQGSINLVQRSADLEYALDAPAMTPRPGIAWQRIALHGSWHGTVSAPAADGRLEVSALQLAGSTRIATLTADLSTAARVLKLHSVVNGLELPGPNPQLLQQSPVTIDASMSLSEATRPLTLAASHRLFSLHAQAITAGEPRVALVLRLTDLAPLAAISGQEMRGNAVIHALLSRGSPGMRMALDANGAVAGGTAGWAAALGDRTRMQLTALLTAQAFDVERLQLSGRSLSFSLSGTATRPGPDSRTGSFDAKRGGAAIQKLQARWDLNVMDLGALSSALAGTLKASGKVNGPITALAVDAQLTSTLSVRGSQNGTVLAAFHARGLPGTSTGSLQAHGMIDAAPLHLDVSFDHADRESWRAQIGRADWKSATAAGELASGTARAPTQGQIRFKVGDLSDLQRLMGMSVQGSAAGSVSLKRDGDHTDFQLALDARNVVAGQFAGNAELSGAGTSEAFVLRLGVKMPQWRGAPASLTSTSELNLAAHQLRITSAEAQYHGQTLKLASAAQLSFADGLSITGLRIGAQQAVFALEGQVSPALDVHATLHRLGPALINAFVPGLLADGSVDADAHLHGTLGTPVGTAHLQASGLRYASDAAIGLPAIDIKADAQLLDNTAQLNATFNAGTASVLTIGGSTPTKPDGEFDLTIAGHLDVNLVNPLLETRGQHATGLLTVDATVAGTAADPQIGGSVSLTKGSLRDYSRGMNLTDITAQIIGGEGILNIKSLTARAASGNVSVTGSVGVLKPGIPVDLQLTAKNAQPIASKIVTATLDADLKLTGKARERIDLAGKIHIVHANVGIPNSLPPNVVVLDVRRRGQAPPGPPEKQLIVGLNLSIDAPRQVLVEGRGLDAELGGEIDLAGTTDAPFVTGSFDLIRGSFSLASSRLMFSDGHVSFNGAGLRNKIDPTLDFTADSTVGSVTAKLRITGLADSPQFEFTSSPTLPQDEILSLLLFGEPASQLNALQVAQIGAALATLSGAQSSLNPLVKLQKSLGLDRLSVGAGTTTNTGTGGTQNSGASIEAGRYVSKRVYVEAKQTTTGASQVQVDVDLTKHLKLQTRLGNGTATAQGTTPETDSGSSIGLSYGFEY